MWDGINKRQFPRANYPCWITVKRKEHPDSIASRTENIGVGGICTVLPKDLGIFAPVEIQLDLLDAQPVITCDGNIVWIVKKTEEHDVSFDTGIEFTNLERKDHERINNIVKMILKDEP